MRKLLLIIFVLFTINSLAQKNGVFYSQVIKNQEFFNPAYSYFSKGVSVNMLLSSKFQGYNKNPKSYALAVDFPLYKNVLGACMNISQENIDIRRISNYNLNLRTSIPITSTSFLSAGIQLGLRTIKNDLSILNDYSHGSAESDILDITNSNGESTIAAGLYYANTFSFLGVGLSDLQSNKEDYNLNYDLYGGLNINLSKYFIFQPSVLYKKYFTDNLVHAKLEGIYKNMLSLALSYTVDKDYGTSVGCKIFKKVWLVYSFELQQNIGGLRVFSNGLNLSYNIDKTTSLIKLLDRSNSFRYL